MLHAHFNHRLAALPASLCTLPKLRVLDLNGCAGLTALPPAVARLAQLDGALQDEDGKNHWLHLVGCTGLVAPPYRVVEGIKDKEHFAAVRAWFDRQHQHQQQQHDGAGGEGGGGGAEVGGAAAAQRAEVEGEKEKKKKKKKEEEGRRSRRKKTKKRKKKK